ncbi:glycerophosphodiester phosphodiesterase family protein [Bifidobacterium saguinibicoloris]|uniref:glycerophosphodiester phosphodiesterase family protein n=1 Tax=Bifidobacterium saguinibicoloris TaxID=2834433 RepID=UPI001C59283D|nr:glycerophosphodiester phosphodiesterase family protein [Bifidobacterium saguinibicoloris]MBW3081582.1 glycerophosphodiester phosphodiesterase [Bifidobacterium saguinibicoloris]
MSKALRNAIIGGAALAGAAAWAMAPRSFNDKRRNFVPVIPDVWYAHRGLHDAGSGLVGVADIPDYTGDNPLSAAADTTEASIAENADYVALARRMAMKAGYGTPDETGPIAPENSLAAFAAACEAGYGIELDLQLTLDGQVVVVHDADLLRVAGDPRLVRDLTYDELTRIPLFPAARADGHGSKPGDLKAHPLPGADEKPPLVVTPSSAPEGYYQHVPLFSDVLKVVAGRAPLIVEYKFSDNSAWGAREEELMEKGHALLDAYSGPYVIESFHPGAVNWYKTHHPEVCRGQLSWPAPFKAGNPLEWAAGLLAFDWLSRPDFVAYDWTGGASPQVRLARAMGATTVSWTVRSSAELADCDQWFDHHIFEAFVPAEHGASSAL